MATSAKEHERSVVKVESVPDGLLRIAAIYGPNASGKSNLFSALRFFVNAVEHSFRSWKPDARVPTSPFALDQTRQEVSEFQSDFLLSETRFEYGFSHNSEQFLTEWLYSFPNNRKQVWFERNSEGSGQIKFGKNLLGENRAIESLTRKNSLFLSAAAQNNHEMISPIFTWLTTQINILMGSRRTLDSDLAKKLAEPESNSRISRLISQADLGIVGLKVESEPLDEKFAELMDDFVEELAKLTSTETDFRVPRQTEKLNFLHHGKSDQPMVLPYEDESLGTVAFLSVLWPAIKALESGGVLCVDELDASLHPMLALEIVRLFSEAREGTRAQLIFNTHDTNLLDSSILRRDEVWFTEKDSEGASRLYSLSDFRPRKKENLKHGYLQGRYGAVPYLGTFNFDSVTD